TADKAGSFSADAARQQQGTSSRRKGRRSKLLGLQHRNKARSFPRFLPWYYGVTEFRRTAPVPAGNRRGCRARADALGTPRLRRLLSRHRRSKWGIPRGHVQEALDLSEGS